MSAFQNVRIGNGEEEIYLNPEKVENLSGSMGDAITSFYGVMAGIYYQDEKFKKSTCEFIARYYAGTALTSIALQRLNREAMINNQTFVDEVKDTFVQINDKHKM